MMFRSIRKVFADTFSDTVAKVDSSGIVSYDFSGHIHATGLDLNEDTGGQIATNMISWLDPLGRQRETIIGTVGALVRSVIVWADNWGGQGVATIINSDGASSFLKVVNGPKVLRHHGRIALADFPPVNPIDGDIVEVLVDDTNGIVWSFVYNAGSGSVFKWEFAGGPPLSSEIDTTETTATTGAYVDLATAGPSITLPRGGDYEFTFGYSVFDSANAALQVRATPKFGAAAAADADNAGFSHQAQGAGIENFTSLSRSRKKAGLATNDVVKLQYKTTLANQPSIMRRFLKCIPIRVS